MLIYASKNTGFSLIEVLLCFFITTIMIAALASVAMQFSQATRLWGQRELALHWARQSIMEIFNNTLSSQAFLSADWKTAIDAAPSHLAYSCNIAAVDAPEVCYPPTYIAKRIAGLQAELRVQLPNAIISLTPCDGFTCLDIRWPKCFLFKNDILNSPCLQIPLVSLPS